MNRSTTSRARHSSVSLMRMGIFTALIAVGAFIRIPVPVCPFTLQLLFTTLAGILLGSRRGGAVLVYLALGLAGVPVFTEGGGIAYIFQPTFGYLIGFAGGAWLTGRIVEMAPSGSLARYVVACFAGLAVVYGCGMVYVYVINKFLSGHTIGTMAAYPVLFPYGCAGRYCALSSGSGSGAENKKSGYVISEGEWV